MSFVFSIKDNLRASVEAATGGKVTVLYDDVGNPSFMVRIPKFKLEDIDSDLGSGVHPAFIVNDQEKSEIFIGQSQAVVTNERAYSLPGIDPTVYVDYDQAVSYCKNKGSGWHLMTVHEWAAVMLWCLKNGFQPRGNTNYGRSHEATYETGTRVDGGTPGDSSGTPRTYTGSGPASWRHDNTFAGISDLVGNIWEWMHLMKLIDGRIYVPAHNDFDLDESNWTAQNAYFDRESASVNNLILSSARNVSDEGQSPDYSYHSPWRTLSLESGFTAPDLLLQICVSPKTTETGGTLTIFSEAKGTILVRNYGERFPRRGGCWGSDVYAGLGALDLESTRSYSPDVIGFRPAYIG